MLYITRLHKHNVTDTMASWRKKREFPCPKCDADFRKESPLRKHLFDAHGLTPAECKQVLFNIKNGTTVK